MHRLVPKNKQTKPTKKQQLKENTHIQTFSPAEPYGNAQSCPHSISQG